MIALLIRLYPARWRARYGDEFGALLGERPLSPFDAADLLLGAVDAHLHLRGLGAYSEHQKGFPMSLRLGGYAAIVGGVLWFAGLVLLQFGSVAAPGPLMVLLGTVLPLMVLLGTVLLLVGLIGLSSFQARRYPRLTWAAFAVPAIGAVVSMVGQVGMVTTGDEPFVGDLSGWYLWMFGSLALVIGSGLFAIATWRVRTLSRRAAALLGSGCLAVLPAVAFASGGPEQIAHVLLGASLLGFAAGWVALGVSAVRTHQAVAPTLEGAAS